MKRLLPFLPVLLAAAGVCTQAVAADALAPAAAAARSPSPQAAAQTRGPVRFRVIPDAGAAGNASVTRPLEEALKNLGARPAGIDDVNNWSERLTAALRQGGFPVGQVLMTQSDWDRATRQEGAEDYVFSVYPGHISGIELKNTSRVADARLLRLITRALCSADTPDRNGLCLLQTSRLERATQLLQDVPGLGMAGAPKFSAGRETGDVQVEFGLESSGEPIQVGAVVDNNGIEATGRARAGVSLSGNNLFHAGDAYVLSLMDTQKGTRTGVASASMPVGYSGLRLLGSVTRQQYTINSITPIAGVSTVVRAGVQYPFTRGLDSNVWGGLWLLHNRTGSSLSEYSQHFRSTINSAQLSIQADNGDRAAQLRTNQWNARSALTFGNNSNNDKEQGTEAAWRAGNYAKLEGSAFGKYGLDKSGDFFVTGRISGQIASRNLDFSEKLVLGGPDAVRAYRADEGSADNGAVINLGLYRRIPVAAGHQLQIGGFADVGYGRVNHSPWEGWESSYANMPNVKNTRVLSGYGLSLDWLTPVGVTLSFTVARPFGFSPASWVKPGEKSNQYWLTATWSR